MSNIKYPFTSQDVSSTGFGKRDKPVSNHIPDTTKMVDEEVKLKFAFGTVVIYLPTHAKAVVIIADKGRYVLRDTDDDMILADDSHLLSWTKEASHE